MKERTDCIRIQNEAQDKFCVQRVPFSTGTKIYGFFLVFLLRRSGNMDQKQHRHFSTQTKLNNHSLKKGQQS